VDEKWLSGVYRITFKDRNRGVARGDFRFQGQPSSIQKKDLI